MSQLERPKTWPAQHFNFVGRNRRRFQVRQNARQSRLPVPEREQLAAIRLGHQSIAPILA